MKALISARSALWVLILFGAPLSVAGQNAPSPEAFRAEARRGLRSATAALGSGTQAAPARRGLLPQIAEAQARAGDLPGARQTTERLRDPHEKAEALAGVACELARTGRLSEARELAEQIAALSPEQSMATSVGGPAVRRVPEDAVVLIHYVEAIGSVVLAQALSGDQKGAHATLARVEVAEYRCAGLFAIVVARLNAGDAAGAKKLLVDSEDFRTCFTEAKDADRAMIDPATALAFIQEANGAQPLATDFRRVLSLFARMYTLDGIENFGYLLGMMSRAGRQEPVDQVLAAGARLAIAAPDRVELFVAGLLWAGDLKDARRAAETFPGEETQARIRRLVAEALAREGDFASALQIAEPIQMRPYQAVALATVAARQMKQDPGPTVRRVLQRAIAATAETRNVPYRFRALCQIARAQAAAGERAAAGKTLEQAAITAHTPGEGVFWSLFVGELVRAYLEIGDPVGALRQASEAPGRKLDADQRAPVLLEIAVSLAGRGRPKDAARVFTEALELAHRDDLPWAACDIAQAWARGGGAPQAAAAAERLTTPVQRSLALLGTAKGLLQLANPDFYHEAPRPWPLEAGRFSQRGGMAGSRTARPPWKALSMAQCAMSARSDR